MAIVNWEYPVPDRITGATKISETDNKIQSALDDLTKWINSSTPYVDSGLKQELDLSLASWQLQVDNIPSTKLDVIDSDMGALLATRNITSVTYDGDDKPLVITYSGGWTVTATYILSGNGEGELSTVTYKRGADTIYSVTYTYGINDKIATQTVSNEGWTSSALYDLMMVAV